MQAPAVRPSVAVHGLFVLFGIVIAAFFPFLALYLDDRGVPASRIGLVITAMAATRAIFLPLWGHVADTRIGRVAALRWGTAGVAAAALAMNLVDGVVAIGAVSCVVSACMVATGPNIDAIALVHLGDERMSDYGRIRGWESLSYAAACLLFGSLLEVLGVRYAMPLYAASSVAVLAWTVLLPDDRPVEVARHGRLGAVGAVFREAPRFWGYLAATLLLWTGFNAAWNFFSLRIEEGGGGPLLVGVGTALGGAVELPVMRLSSRLHRRVGIRLVYVAGCLLNGLGFLLWGLVDDPTLISLLTVFEGMAFALLFTTSIVIVGRLLPPTLYSTGNSVSAMVGFGMAPIIGAGSGGFVYQYLGATQLFTAASALALAGAVVAWFALDTPRLAGPGRPVVAPTAGIEPEPGLVP